MAGQPAAVHTRATLLIAVERLYQQGLAIHPMLQKIMEALARGESYRSIAEWVRPRVDHSTIAKFHKRVIKPELEKAEAIKEILEAKKEENKAVARTDNEPSTAVNTSTPVQQIARASILGGHSLAIRENRIKTQQEIARRIATVIEERAKDFELCEHCRRPSDAHPWEEMGWTTNKDGEQVEIRHACDKFVAVPGGTTGLVIRKLKSTGVEYAVDTALLAELREQEKMVAIELGQWQENAGSGLSIQIICPQAPIDAMPRVALSQDGAAPIDADFEVIEEIGITNKR